MSADSTAWQQLVQHVSSKQANGAPDSRGARSFVAADQDVRGGGAASVKHVSSKLVKHFSSKLVSCQQQASKRSTWIRIKARPILLLTASFGKTTSVSDAPCSRETHDSPSDSSDSSGSPSDSSGALAHRSLTLPSSSSTASTSAPPPADPRVSLPLMLSKGAAAALPSPPAPAPPATPPAPPTGSFGTMENMRVYRSPVPTD
jgi:hypothetical protein